MVLSGCDGAHFSERVSFVFCGNLCGNLTVFVRLGVFISYRRKVFYNERKNGERKQ